MKKKRENKINYKFKLKRDLGFVLIAVSVLVLTVFTFYDLNIVSNENCECLEKQCVISYDSLQMKKITTDNLDEFVAKTYDGPIVYIEDGSAIFYEKRAKVIAETLYDEEKIKKAEHNAIK